MLNCSPRSGNPGYIKGRTIRFGFKNDNIIQTERVGGLTVNTPLTKYDPTRPQDFGRGYCPRSGGDVAKQSVLFGYDVSTGCTMHLNRSELISFCCTGASSGCPSNDGRFTSPYSQSDGLPHFLNMEKGYWKTITISPFTTSRADSVILINTLCFDCISCMRYFKRYVALYGNSDIRDLNQWFRLNLDEADDTRSWSDRTSTCSNMWTCKININFTPTAQSQYQQPPPPPPPLL